MTTGDQPNRNDIRLFIRKHDGDIEERTLSPYGTYLLEPGERLERALGGYTPEESGIARRMAQEARIVVPILAPGETWVRRPDGTYESRRTPA